MGPKTFRSGLMYALAWAVIVVVIGLVFDQLGFTLKLLPIGVVWLIGPTMRSVRRAS